MILYPAIDLIDGEVVRLKQGDFARKTVFASSPHELLKHLVEQNATCLHLVDLSGARDPAKRQLPLLKELVDSFPLRIQVGGGIRSLEQIEELLKIGVDRVVLGSLVLTEPEVAKSALKAFGPSRLTFALDIQMRSHEPIVMTHGWQRSSNKTFSEVLTPYLELGLKRVLCTDISVDGLPTGPNVPLYRSLLKTFPDLELQASGGVDQLSDLTSLKDAGLHSVVIGRALLTGSFTFREAQSHVE